MSDYLFHMQSKDKDPFGSGDMKSWFEFYKCGAGETHIPTRNPNAVEVKAGDYLWFLMDNHIISVAKVIRDVLDVPPGDEYGKFEIWYDSDKMQKTEPVLVSGTVDGPPSEWVRLLLGKMRPEDL